ncbi:two-component sensor histidine kinase [Rhodococcus sp. HNM0563]|nr:two-component sensor histidine kinase [Rhodococcus sp. HNM0563]
MLGQTGQAWRRLDVTARDLALGVVLIVISYLPGFRSNGTQIGDLATRPTDALAFVALALECLPLAIRRRLPVVCLALVSLGFCLDQLRGYHSFAGIGLCIALFSVGAHLHRYRYVTAVAFSVVYVAFAVSLTWIGAGEPPSEFVTFYLALTLPWGIGAWVRTARIAESEHRRRVAEDTRTAERIHIARELHDVVTHHVTAMIVQAEAARYLTAAPERLDGVLTDVSDTGRKAITDLRHILNLLDPDHGLGDRTPAVGRLHTLIEQTRRAGQPVEFTEEGCPAASAGSADLVAYRVVQEALTNALKYDHGGRTSVQVSHGEKEITVTVGTDGSGSSLPDPGGSGRGLAGLRERVDILGGDFRTENLMDGGYLVSARIPAGNPS